MKNNLEYASIPYAFTICLKRECSLAGNCLRQIAEQLLPLEIVKINILNPKHVESLPGDCPYYKSADKERYAKGFIQLLEKLPQKQARCLTNALINSFGRKNYYRIRKGERLLSPSEQECIRKTLKTCGIGQPLTFDAYVDTFTWE